MEAGTALVPSSRPQRSGRAWPTLCWLPCRTADTRVLSGMVGVGAHSLAASLSQQPVGAGGELHHRPGSQPAWGGVCAPLLMAPSAP